VRSERDKWRVPENDPAGNAARIGQPTGSLVVPGPSDLALPVQSAERARLIYCGQCGALNPATNAFCSACGATLVDAFHASEGLRVYDKPDTASRLIEIVPPGTELDIVDDPDAAPEFVRVSIETGRLGYIRVGDLTALADLPAAPPDPLGTPNINTNARGCITQTGALLALVLLLMLSTLTVVYISTADAAEQGIIALAACVSLGPLLVITIAMYVYARSRDERREADAEDALYEAQQRARTDTPES